MLCGLRRRSRHGRPTARGVPAGTFSRVPARVPALGALSLSLFPSYLPPLSSQAKSNVYCTKFAERNALSQVHLWVSRFFPLLRSVQTRRPPHMLCFGYVCTDTKQHLSVAQMPRRGQPSASTPLATFRFPSWSYSATDNGQSHLLQAFNFQILRADADNSVRRSLPVLTGTRSWRQEVAWSP